LVGFDEHDNAAWAPRLASYQSGLLQVQHHVVNGWRGNAEVPLQISLGWCLSITSV
jgi:cytochrome c5